MIDRLNDVISFEDRIEYMEKQTPLHGQQESKRPWKHLLYKQKLSCEKENVRRIFQQKSHHETDGDLCEDVELGTIKPNTDMMRSFFDDVETIQVNLRSIRDAVSCISDIGEQTLSASKTEKENNLSTNLEATVGNANQTAKQIKKLLSQLKEETSELSREGKTNPSNIRIRENLINTLTRKFVDEVRIYQKTQQTYQGEIKSKAARQIMAVKPDATEQEIDAVMHSDGGRDALYKESILSGGISDAINTGFNRVSTKYKDIVTLEKSLADLRQIFLDFALLTEQQGELLDQIELHVQKASDAVEDGNIDLERSIEYQRKIRNKQCWIIVFVLVIAAVVFAILFK